MSSQLSLVAAQNSNDHLWDSNWIEGNGEKTIKLKNKVENIKLYSLWLCPFAQRAWIALEEKGLSYQYIEINPYSIDITRPGGYSGKALNIEEKTKLFPEFVSISPRGLVPAIDDGK